MPTPSFPFGLYEKKETSYCSLQARVKRLQVQHDNNLLPNELLQGLTSYYTTGDDDYIYSLFGRAMPMSLHPLDRARACAYVRALALATPLVLFHYLRQGLQLQYI
jgi:hypothetical protein